MDLRLLLFKECNRDCPLCCNKGFDLKSLPVCADYTKYDSIVLTGGEPLINPKKVHEAIDKIRKVYAGKIFLYTAKTDDKKALASILDRIDGITITLHDNGDIEPFKKFNQYYKDKNKSFRLTVFSVVKFRKAPKRWNMKVIDWIVDCPLPKNEVFMRYE